MAISKTDSIFNALSSTSCSVIWGQHFQNTDAISHRHNNGDSRQLISMEVFREVTFTFSVYSASLLFGLLTNTKDTWETSLSPDFGFMKAHYLWAISRCEQSIHVKPTR